MMIDCPRCGFNQPKDQFCAKCGVDMEHFKVKPKPLWLRLVQNPNLYLSLIGILIVVVIGYILTTRAGRMSQEMDNLLDRPLLSRDAGDPNEVRPAPPSQRAAPTQAVGEDDASQSPTQMSAKVEPAATSSTAAAAAEPEDVEALNLTSGHKLDISHWEIPREVVANLLPLADKVGSGNAGRAYLFKSGAKVLEQIASVGQRLSLGRAMNARNGEQMTSVTPPTTPEAFQYGLFFQITKVEGKDLGLKWESQLVLPQTETPAEAASAAPAVRAIVETRLSGGATLKTSSLLVILMEPSNRSPREELLTRAGEGPWTVFASPEYRAGLTDWLIVAQIKGP